MKVYVRSVQYGRPLLVCGRDRLHTLHAGKWSRSVSVSSPFLKYMLLFHLAFCTNSLSPLQALQQAINFSLFTQLPARPPNYIYHRFSCPDFHCHTCLPLTQPSHLLASQTSALVPSSRPTCIPPYVPILVCRIAFLSNLYLPA